MLYQFNNLNAYPDLIHAVTTTRFNHITNFNLADHVGMESENAISHRRMLTGRLGLSFDRLTVARQVHENNVSTISSDNAGAGHAGWKTGIPQTDAMITDLADTPLMVLSADCPLILVYDPTVKSLGVIHASWRCTFSGIITRTVEAMAKTFNCRPENLSAGIGPGAGPCCYEVDEKFVQTIQVRPELMPFIIQRESQMYFDLWSAGRSELIRAGVLPDHIEQMNRCSICDEQFFSFRRQAGQAGRFGLVASIKT
ncbi:MAG: peptidoglycan editing factor PgeF [Phycisphaerae bacterium]